MKGHCIITCTPIRSEMSDRAEMISQLLYGEVFEIIESHQNWTKIKCADDYVGWIDSRVIENQAKKSSKTQSKCFVNKILSEITTPHGNLTTTYGAELNADEDEFSIHDFCFSEIKKIEVILADAQLFINTPYLWGGKSSYGVDCSGLIQTLAKVNGYLMPRDAYQQASIGKTIDFAKRQAGDLAYFKNNSGSIVHVGILSSKDKIIHASGWVREDPIDKTGIFDESRKIHSHHLAEIKRVFQ